MTYNITLLRRGCPSTRLVFIPLRGLAAQDIGVTSIQDCHGGAAEKLTASSSKLDLLDQPLARLFPPKSDDFFAG